MSLKFRSQKVYRSHNSQQQEAAIIFLACFLLLTCQSAPCLGAQGNADPTVFALRGKKSALPLSPGKVKPKTRQKHPKDFAAKDGYSDIANWQVQRKSQGRRSKQCLTLSKEVVACRDGEFSGPFWSKNHGRFFDYFTGSDFPPMEKALSLFSAKGQLIKEIQLPKFGRMVGFSPGRADVFLAMFRQDDGVHLNAFNFDGDLLWNTVFTGEGLSGRMQHKLKATTNGDWIVATTSPNPFLKKPGKTRVLNSQGEVLAEFDLGDATILIAPNQHWTAIWGRSEGILYDFTAKEATYRAHLPHEVGTSYTLDAISGDNRKVIFSEIVRARPGGKRPRRLSRVFVLDVKDDALRQFPVDEKLPGVKQLKLLQPNELELSTPDETVTYALGD